MLSSTSRPSRSGVCLCRTLRSLLPARSRIRPEHILRSESAGRRVNAKQTACVREWFSVACRRRGPHAGLDCRRARRGPHMQEIGHPPRQLDAGNRPALSRQSRQGRTSVRLLGRARQAIRASAQPGRFRQTGFADAVAADDQSAMHHLQRRAEFGHRDQADGRHGERVRRLDRDPLGTSPGISPLRRQRPMGRACRGQQSRRWSLHLQTALRGDGR